MLQLPVTCAWMVKGKRIGHCAEIAMASYFVCLISGNNLRPISIISGGFQRRAVTLLRPGSGMHHHSPGRQRTGRRALIVSPRSDKVARGQRITVTDETRRYQPRAAQLGAMQLVDPHAYTHSLLIDIVSTQSAGRIGARLTRAVRCLKFVHVPTVSLTRRGPHMARGSGSPFTLHLHQPRARDHRAEYL